ncbi:penicillin acylase family protein [Arvimicrobium flavum]|uniref:penicillin acylase family protein n=1 Tax=Arvimicrobium flavum TaxID=3393320 RepID=UPI00237A80E2|nr:penicillin acylase family protein [Mesorhizobium shangrilense]
MPASSETYSIAGLERPVEILVDRWGVPHVYAADDLDVFVGQGFAVARDRLWQIDVWRKRGLGQLAADYGPSFVEADRAARLLLYRGDIEPEWAAYGEDARAVTEAFVRGINAYIALVDAEPARMPVEFTRTGTRPARWNAEDCVRIRSHGPLYNFARELIRADIVGAFGMEAELARKRPEPKWTIIPAEGLGAEPIPAEVRRIFELGTGQPNFADASNPSAELGGSNNWAIAGSRTDTGRPILASDPHRLLLLPALRYVSHLSAPGLDVIGAGEPAIPGIAIGHNATSAFCLTIHPADQSDLYVYELDPEDSSTYRYGDGWEHMEIVEEELAVRGEVSRKIQLTFTRHGPVLHVDHQARRAYVLRSIWSQPGSAPYFGALRYIRATSWDEFVEARSHWLTPTVNHVYADVSGDIGWIMSGHVPTRRDWDGLLPVAGDGSREWDGFMPADAHPSIHNPARGWVATANEMNLPEDFDYATWRPGFEWCDPTRYQAIARELEKGKRHGLGDSQALQTSFASITAERLVAALPGVTLVAGEARRAAALLGDWDGVVGGDSAAAMLFEIWFRRHLIEAVLEQLAPGAFARIGATDIAGYDTLQITDLMVRPDARFGPAPEARRDEIVDTTLAAAWREAVAHGGHDPSVWRWDKLHHAQFVHPLSALTGTADLDTPRVGKGGSGLTPNAADYRPDDFRMTVGASFRMVLDIGEWDRGVFINAPGQSGEPRSPHYSDHLDYWGREDYLPLLFSRAAIESATELRIILEPASDAPW